MLKRYKKQVIIGLLIATVMVTAVPVLLRPESALTFGLFPGVPQPTIETVSIPNAIWRAIDKGLKIAADTTFKNQLNRFLNNLAYNTAVKIATGQSGQKPLFFDLNSVIREAADQAVGEFSAQLLTATSGGGTCEITGRECVSDNQCSMVALFKDAQGSHYEPIQSEAEYEELLFHGTIVPDSLRREKCQRQLSGGFGGIDICSIRSPAAEIVIKTVALDITTPPPPRCTFTELKQNIEDLRQIDTGGLVRVTTLYNQRSNELGIIHNLTLEAQERRSAAIAQKNLKVIAQGGIEAAEDAVTEDTKTPASFVEEAAKESLFRTPFKSYLNQTGSLVADAIGVFTNTLVSKLLTQVFDKGFRADDQGLVSNRFFGGLSGVAAARLKFAELLKLSDIKTSQRSADTLLQQLVSGCSDEVSQAGVSSINPDAFREVNNCIIDEPFRLAIEQKLTVREALNLRNNPGQQTLLDPHRDFGVHADGGGDKALAGTSCQGCDAEIYSLRSILVLRKYRVVPVGWELAAKYIKDLLQPSGDVRAFSLADLTAAYGDPTSPFYRLVDPDWQLKAPVAIQEVKGPGDRIISEFYVRNQDTNNDGRLDDKDQPTRVIQRGQEAADEQTCIWENQDGTCAYYGYCTEEKPVWRVFGSVCDERFDTCQTFVRGGDQSRVSYLTKTADISVCAAANAGCRQFTTLQDTTGSWTNAGGTSMFAGGSVVYADRDAPVCQAQAAGCSEFLRLSDIAGNPLTAPAAEAIVQSVQSAGGEIADYGSSALVEKIYLKQNRLDCSEPADFDGNGLPDDNVACRLYNPTSYAGPGIPGVTTPPTLDGSGAINSYNDFCPAECVGYQPYEELPAPPFYPAGRSVDFIASTARQCSASDVGCTEFTNIGAPGQGGESLVYYSDVRECVSTTAPGLEQFFTWEGSEDTGFQLRSWLLIGGGPTGGPSHAGDTGYNLCDAAIFNLPPDDPSANPDCREYIDVDLNRHYALASLVIIGTEQCQLLRRTDTGTEYSVLPSGSRSCSAAAVGCRQYQGYGSGNVQQVLNSTFESGSTEGWGGGTLSNESVVLGGHSLQVSGSLGREVSLRTNQRYVLSFWAKGSGSATAILGDAAGSSQVSLTGSATLGPDWQEFQLGPALADWALANTSRITIAGLGVNSFIDNIRLQESNNLYLIRDSWNTPAICAAPESQLFCEAYRNDQGQPQYLKNFTRLCQEQFVGCEALVNTYNSDIADTSPTVYGVSVPADTLEYYVNNQAYYCQAAAAGCTALGLVTVDRDSQTSYATQYRKLDPEQFELSLCQPEAELCEDYTPLGASGGFSQFFKNPLDRTCEYRTNVLLPSLNRVVSGWFRTGASPITAADVCQLGSVPDEPANPVCNFNYASSTYEDLITIAADHNLNRYPPGCYTYQCPAEQSSCTEFQDPISPVGCDPQLKPGQTGPNGPACDYYYFLQDSLSSGIAECRGEIDAGLGCVGFFETERGEESKYLRADCQPGCPLVSQCHDGSGFTGTPCTSNSNCNPASGVYCRGLPVREYPDCTLDTVGQYPTSKPGCVF